MTPEAQIISDQLTQFEVELLRISGEHATLIVEAAQKRASYDVRYAQELLKVKTNKDLKLTVPEVEAMAVSLVKDELTDCRIAEAMASAAKTKLDATKSILSSIQSRAGLIKSEAFLTASSVN